MENNTSIKKIAVVGPESTGKSTISEQLADHYQTVWVPEYSREYCSKLTGPCSWEDEINMFRGQLALEEELLPRANKLLICDTTFITVKIWSDYVFGKAPEEVLSELPKRHYDLYLLMDIDLPWEDDPLRNFPDLREYFMGVWKEELERLNANYAIINGTQEARKNHAIDTINDFFNLF